MTKPIQSSDDLRAFIPGHIRRPVGESPVLDDGLEALTAICEEWQDETELAVMQSDLGQSTDQYLQGQAEDRGSFKQDADTNTSLRNRVITAPKCVDRLSIVAAVNAVLAPYTSVSCRVFESIRDRLYIGDGTNSWHSYIGARPTYPSRYYDSRPSSQPPGAWVFGDEVGRFLVILIPVVSSAVQASVFEQVVGAVAGLKGQGIRWQVCVKAGLT